MNQGIEIDEVLIFERSSNNFSGIDWYNSEVSDSFIEQAAAMLSKHAKPKEEEILLPNISEPDAVRHFTRLSKKNFSIDTSSYPLGSCTMKYNPKIHEWAARLCGLSSLHPYLPANEIPKALEIIFDLQNYLSQIGGFYATSMAPSAGAQGEFAGLAMINKAHKDKGEERNKILVPKSAHGTNPATAAFFSYEVVSLDIGSNGRMILAQVANLMDDKCAGIMVTNPNTLGIFESEQREIAKVVHDHGGYVYGDGANLNALMGTVRPGDMGVDVMHFNLHKTMTTPHGGGGPGCGAIGACEELAKYLPIPFVKKDGDSFNIIEDSPHSIGRIRSFYGNFGMMVRAWIYIRSLGPDGLKKASQIAVLNANYLKQKLAPYFHLPYDSDCLHEVVFSDKWQMQNGVSALDIAKRLLDYGIHPPTMYFPLVVKGALMIEPTETESRYELDKIVEAFIKVAIEAKENPELVKSAPHNTRLSRLNEALGARNPRLSYQELKLA